MRLQELGSTVSSRPFLRASTPPSTAPRDAVRLGTTPPPPLMPRPLAASVPTPQQVLSQVSAGLAPLLQMMLPQKVLLETADILSGCYQTLGQPPPPVSPDQAQQFLSDTVATELTVKGQEKLQEATPLQVSRLVTTGQALIPVLQGMSQDDMKKALDNPPPQLNDFIDAYLEIGVPKPDDINAGLSPHRPGPAAAVTQATGRPSVPGHQIKFCINGTQAYPEWERMLIGAQKSILMETYTWHDDDTGQRMVDLLVAKKQQGVDVKVIYDSLGQNSDSPDRPKKMLTQLAAAGIEAIEYNRDVSGPTGVNLTHRKLVIVDGESALLGGMNVGDNYSKYWHDSMVRVDGPAVADIVREYAFDWQQAGGSGAMLSLPASPKPLNGDSEVAVLVTSPRQPEKARQIHTGLMAAYDAARKEIWIENPYFSDPVMVAHLQAAQRRGVQVNVILPRGNDEPLFTQLNAIAAHDLVADGARTWLIDTGPNNLNFNHTKMSMVDGQWVMMGSSNADPRTYEDNQECNVAITDRSVCDDVKQRLIDVDLTKSLPYQPPDLPPNASLLRLAASFL